MRKYTDKYLLRLWRQAVLKEYDSKCFICGNTVLNEIDCHHIVKRRNRILRYDYWNGIPVCRMGCHNDIDSIAGRDILRDRIPTKIDYCAFYERMTLKEYLSSHSMTRDEFYFEKAENLKYIIRGEE